MSTHRIVFLGVGNLASAMVHGLLDKEVYTPSEIACTSRTNVTAKKLATVTGITHEADLSLLLAPADVVVVAFKPQSLASADPRLAELTGGKLVISVLAGKTTKTLAKTFPKARNIIRTMPNTPLRIGAGMTAYCTRSPLKSADKAKVQRILHAFGEYTRLPEKQMNAATALGGSGPAFLFEFVAGLRDAGIAAHLPDKIALKIAVETVLGAARLLARRIAENKKETPETLRDKVTSPNGTTYAGLQVLAGRQFRETLKETILAATRRAGELSRDS